MFIPYLPSNRGFLWCYPLSFSNLITWNGLWKRNPLRKYVLCAETEWREMFISNRYKVTFVVQCRYATWLEYKWNNEKSRRRKSYTDKHWKNCIEIGKQDNYKNQGRKKILPRKKVSTPHPSPNRINRATITTLIGAVISLLLIFSTISLFRHIVF